MKTFYTYLNFLCTLSSLDLEVIPPSQEVNIEGQQRLGKS